MKEEKAVSEVFATPILREAGKLIGPWRKPRQMLAQQTYDGHASIHDDATAQSLGFRGGTVEGPTHFSQVDPLAHALWGERWFAEGCLSAHYRNAAYEGEEVRAVLEPDGPSFARLRMEKRDGTEVLCGTVSCGPDAPPSELDLRVAGLTPPDELVILRDVRVGMRTGRIPVSMAPDQHMGDLYPFTLRQKLAKITEPSPRYDEIIPFEMVSVLLNHVSREHGFPARGPAVALFADQEIRMLAGPLRVGQAYEIEREVVALSASRRTESTWIRTCVFEPGGAAPIATMLLNSATLKDSYANYESDRALLGDEARHA
jgi:hypothetical protein